MLYKSVIYKHIMLCILLFFVNCSVSAQIKGATLWQAEQIDIVTDNALSTVSVGFGFRVVDNKYFVAYYNNDKDMVVASKGIGEKEWKRKILPTKIKWDAHNYVTMALDKQGYIHVSGNMHGVPLIYFKSTAPYDVSSMVQVKNMVDPKDENRVTYPIFLEDPNGEMVFHYRFGSSGNGLEIYNTYDVNTKQWRRLLDTPLIHGQWERNAYMQGPMMGKDGFYHAIWVWRETGDCSSNHTLSYARSKDLLNWESIRGEKITLPMNFYQKELVVDPTSVKGGLLNPGIKLGFDSQNRPVIGYHKYDKSGNTQLYVCRFENGKWKFSKLTDWNYRWDFKGVSTIKMELEIFPPVPISEGLLAFDFQHFEWGDKRVVINEKTLKTVKVIDGAWGVPEKIVTPSLKFTASNGQRMISRYSNSGDYYIRWDCLEPNRDRAPADSVKLPPASVLEIYKVTKK